MCLKSDDKVEKTETVEELLRIHELLLEFSMRRCWSNLLPPVLS